METHRSTSDVVESSSKDRSKRKMPWKPSPKQKNHHAAPLGATTAGTQTPRAKSQRTFSQPSVMQAGDKGIFVTSDKGREKKCLLELMDLVEEHLNQEGDVPDARFQEDRDSGVDNSPEKSQGTGEAVHSLAVPHGSDIEADILAELAGLTSGQHDVTPLHTHTMRSVSQPIRLITLDIPCVSFLRFPPGSGVDPVQVVHQICRDAAAVPLRPRSRYIKRMTPIARLGKSLSHGLDTVCDELLPRHFHVPDEVRASGPSNQAGRSFAIKPTVRNNDRLDRGRVIQTVADKVQALGRGRHTVDLTGYELGIVVEVYRGWVGMCVVPNRGQTAAETALGYEALKRFNLSEIYTAGIQA